MEAALTIAAGIASDLHEIRSDFARCDWSRANEFNARYYDARLQLMNALENLRGPRAEPPEARALLLLALEREIRADSVRSTSMQIAIAEGRTSGCDAGDDNELDDQAREARREFVEFWNRFAPEYGGREWEADDF